MKLCLKILAILLGIGPVSGAYGMLFAALFWFALNGRPWLETFVIVFVIMTVHRFSEVQRQKTKELPKNIGWVFVGYFLTITLVLRDQPKSLQIMIGITISSVVIWLATLWFERYSKIPTPIKT